MADCAIVLAGGSGVRFGGKKQFLEFRGKQLWKIVADKASEVVGSENVVTVGVDIPGGDTRTHSVQNGLNEMMRRTGDEGYDRLIICEAARPLVSVERIRQLLDSPAPSVSFVMPLVNTVIKRDGTYLNRGDMYELLTPQAFDMRMLKEAYDSGRFEDVTDDTRIMFEYHGVKPTFIEADQMLFKVTYKRDVATLETLYQLQQENDHKE